MHVAGLFKEGRNISIIGSVVNLVVSVIFAYCTGIFGVFFGTFFTYIIQIVMKIYYVYKLKFGCSGKRYYLYMLNYIILFALLVLINTYLCGLVNTSVHILDFIIQGVISAGVSGLSILLCYWRSEEIKYYKRLVFSYLKKLKK